MFNDGSLEEIGYMLYSSTRGIIDVTKFSDPETLPGSIAFTLPSSRDGNYRRTDDL